jgi:hypothetical protein
LILLQFALYSQEGDRKIKYHPPSDTGYHKRGDTIFFSIFDGYSRTLENKRFYIKEKGFWVNKHVNGKIAEKGKFKKKKYGLRYIFMRKTKMLKTGLWQYFDLDGKLILEEVY